MILAFIFLASTEGQQLFAHAQAKEDFFALVATFEQQESQAFCGVASSVTVLNALNHGALTQSTIFDAAARQSISRGGVTLDQLTGLLSSQGVDARGTHASAATLAEFRAMASANLSRTNDFVLVDFLRTRLGQDFGAHWSPLAAYDAASDSFLVLDVNRRRYAPYWVKADELFEAMNTFDPDALATRGWIEVSRRAGSPPGTAPPRIAHKLYAFLTAAVVLIFSIGFFVGRKIAIRPAR
jgi:hypothetical protein